MTFCVLDHVCGCTAAFGVAAAGAVMKLSSCAHAEHCDEDNDSISTLSAVGVKFSSLVFDAAYCVVS